MDFPAFVGPDFGRRVDRLAIRGVCQSCPAATIVLTEQTEFAGLAPQENSTWADFRAGRAAGLAPYCLLFALMPAARDHLHVFHVMFCSPQIAPNTGNAIRMVAATGCELHLVEPLGFDLSEPKLRRAGLDYHDLASVTVHSSLAEAWHAVSAARVFAFTAHARASFADISYEPGDVLLFGPEPSGLDAHTVADPHITAAVRIPMIAGRRSLNLSNAAAVAVYEAWRQHGFAGAL